MKVRNLQHIALCGFLALFTACSNPSSTDTSNEGVAIDGELEAKKEKIKNLFYLIPSPIETMVLLEKAGAEYDSYILSNPQNSDKYDTKQLMALNLGVYGSDLSFSTMFEQTQETMFFLSAAKKLAEGLSIMEAFDQSTIDRIEENIDDKDSLMMLISDSYLIIDTYLKESENVATSALIIFGGWIEGIYIATQSAKNNPGNQEMRTRIAEQKYSFNNLVSLFEDYQQDPDLGPVYNDLMDLKTVFDKVEITTEVAVVKNKGEVASIGGGNSISLDETDLEALTAKILEIRNKYVNS